MINKIGQFTSNMLMLMVLMGVLILPLGTVGILNMSNNQEVLSKQDVRESSQIEKKNVQIQKVDSKNLPASAQVTGSGSDFTTFEEDLLNTMETTSTNNSQ